VSPHEQWPARIAQFNARARTSAYRLYNNLGVYAMKPRVALIAGSSLLLALVSHLSSAAPADVIRFNGRSANAFFESTSGCIGTIVNVFASERVLGNPSNGGEVFVEINQFDSCNNGESLLAASGSAPITAANFQVDANLAATTLDVTVTLTDVLSGSSFEVAVEDLNWIATSSRGHQNTHSNFRFQGCHINIHLNGAFRLGEAGGVISDGTTNFIPDSSLAGNLFSTVSGDRSRGC